jgi:DNA-binding SARP family transcriptional activator/TolB-like protein/cytochrome c-type biogenesis protein CcmH/NrfG
MHLNKPNQKEGPRSGLTIRLFGGMAIQDPVGEDYLPRSRKARAVVAVLALLAPKAMQRGQLTALLWSQRGTQQGRASLRQAVHELQWTLGTDWSHILVAERHSLSIDLNGVAVDAIDAADALAPNTTLLTMFETGFLEDLGGLDPAFDIWLLKERRRLARIASSGGVAFLAEQHPRDATILAARSLLRLDPGNDGAWRALIEAHIEASDRAAARVTCEQWGEAMGLGPDDRPPPELAAFLSRIRFGSAWRPPSIARNQAMPNGVMETVVLPGQSLPVGAASDTAMPDWVVPGGVLADGVTPVRIIPVGPAPGSIPHVRILSEGAFSNRHTSDWATHADRDRDVPLGTREDVIVPERGVPAGIRYGPMPPRPMPGGAMRDRTPDDVAALNGVMEDATAPVGPARAMPGRIMPDGAVAAGSVPSGMMEQSFVPTRGVPDAVTAPAAERWDTATAPWAGTAHKSSGLRLGIREMRVIGPNVDQALSAGLAEEVTTALSRFRWISCVSGSSLAAIAGETGEINLRWPELDLDLLLDGTIQRGGDRVRITVRLLDMRAGEAVIWANRFDHDAADTLTVQDKVAAAIVAQVDPLLLMREGDRAATRNPRGVSARDLVLQAVPAIYRMDRLSFHAAGELLEAALRIEPGNTDALAWYAYWHLFLVGQGWASDPDAATRRAGELADAAVAMDPNDARALTLAGHVRGFLLRRPSEAAVLHERAISLNPNLAIAWCFSGFTLSYLGDHATALARMAKAIELSPSDPHLFFFHAAIIMPLLLLGEFEEAAAAGRKAIELNPWFSSSFKGLLAALGHLGQVKEAASVMARLLRLEPDFTVRDAIARSPMGLPMDIERYADGLRRAGLAEW